MRAFEVFTWCPFIALVLGAAATLGFFRSRTWGFGLVGAALFAQVAVWTILLLADNVRQHSATAEWNTLLEASFLSALLGVVPYAVIGAVCGGLMLVVARFSVRQEVEEAKDGSAGGQAISRPSVLRK